MTDTVHTLEPVIREVTVPADPPRAFELYVRRYRDWAITDHYLGADEPEAIVLEPEVGGRWYERQPDGTECDWGRVLELDDPHRIVLSWHIGLGNDAWSYDPDPAHASRVEITFTAATPGQTVVRIAHSGFEAHGAGAEAIRGGVASDQGWNLDLAAFVAAVKS